MPNHPLQASIFYPLLFLVFSGLFFAQPATAKMPKAKTHALVIYSCDANDHYPFPSQALRDSLYSRVSGLYRTVSYGQHEIRFTEVTNDGGFFVSEHASGYYHKHYDRTRHLRGFGMFNEEILTAVKAKFGDGLFASADLLVVVGTDAGPDWYIPKANATGYGMLGVDFEAGGKLFGKRQRQGGLTIEIGSDIGTRDPADDRLMQESEIQWNLAHEYGHWLGLGHRSARRGIYSLMSPKLFTNDNFPASGPVPLDIFEIMRLGWLDATDSTRVVTLSLSDLPAKVTLTSIRSHVGPVLAKLESGKTTYYFTHHKRSNRFDGAYAGEGLLVWQKRGRRTQLRRAVAGSPGQDGPKPGVGRGGLETDFINAGSREIVIPLARRRSSRQTSAASGLGKLLCRWLQEDDGQVSFCIALR